MLAFAAALLLMAITSPARADFIGNKSLTLETGESWLNSFEITGTSQQFAIYFTSDYSAQAVVASESQMTTFENGGGITGAYSSFQNQFGIEYFTLPPGRYFVGVRSSSDENRVSIELETFPPGDEDKFIDTVVSETDNLAPGRRLIQPFNFSSPRHYVIEGCNTGLEYYLIPKSAFDDFLNDRTFEYFEALSGPSNSEDRNMPGLLTIRNLADGEYGLAFRNTSDKSAALTYALYAYGSDVAADTVDLVDGDANQRTLSRSSGLPGQSFEVQSRIRNQGTATAGNFTVRYYASSNTSITAGDRFLGSYSHSSLQGGYYNSTPRTLNIPQSLLPGFYFIGWIIDADDSVAESNESNNTAFVPQRFQVLSASVPEILVEYPRGNSLADGVSKRKLGTVKRGRIGPARTFRIRNTGSATLSGLNVSVRGLQARDFLVTGPNRTSVSPDGFTTFTVRFRPTARGTRTTTLEIRSNDVDESPFDIKLSGFGTAP